MSAKPLKLTRLMNADGEVVGYFSDYVAEMAARKAWDSHEATKLKEVYPSHSPDTTDEMLRRAHYDAWIMDRVKSHRPCRSIATPIAPAELEDVEPGDGDQVDYIFSIETQAYAPVERMEQRLWAWEQRGATAVEVSRHLVNRYRRPGKSSRDADLGGPAEAAGVLYVLKIKAPK